MVWSTLNVPKISRFRQKTMGHGILPKMGQKMIINLKTPLERARFKLSEINEIESPELKLWCVTSYANLRYIA